MKGFLRRERYITHVRIHTGEKPFVCGVCSRGYRDKRELKKHQATHNHIDQLPGPDSPPPVSSAPMTQPTANPAPVVVAPARTVSGLSPTKTITVSTAQAPNNSMATITFSLPTEPVPKNQLGMAPDPFPAPLNPAHIQLPPSVATALQNMNQKAKPSGIMLASTTPVKQETVTQISGGHVIKQIQGVIEGGDGTQLTLAPSGSFPGIVAANGGPQVFYYVMPSNVQPLITEGVRASGGEGATQFVALPAGALQAASVPVSSVNGSFPQWIIGRHECKICFKVVRLLLNLNNFKYDHFS